jgi:hypothetical protein
MRNLLLGLIALLFVTSCSREQFRKVDPTQAEILSEYRLSKLVGHVYKFEWTFDRRTVTSVVVESRVKGAKNWTVLSRMKEAPTEKSSVTILLDFSPEARRPDEGFLLRLGWGFEHRLEKGSASGWGSRDVILPGPIGTDLHWETSQDNPEEMFSMGTNLNDYRIRMEKAT